MTKKQLIRYADGSSGNWLSSLFEYGGDILTGAANIVGAANTKTENVNKNETSTVNTNFRWLNGTTITAIVVGGVAVTIALILVLRKK